MKKLMALAVAVALALGFTAAPAQALPVDCISGGMCVYDNVSSPYVLESETDGAVARNTCILAARDGIVSYLYNRTGVRWYYFRTTSCGGSHIEVPPFGAGSVLAYAPDSSWNDSIVAVMRTSSTF